MRGRFTFSTSFSTFSTFSIKFQSHRTFVSSFSSFKYSDDGVLLFSTTTTTKTFRTYRSLSQRMYGTWSETNIRGRARSCHTFCQKRIRDSDLFFTIFRHTGSAVALEISCSGSDKKSRFSASVCVDVDIFLPVYFISHLGMEYGET